MDEDLYIRLSDVPVPRKRWFWALLCALAVADRRRGDARARRDGERIGEDLARSVVARWEAVDHTAEAMLKMTRTMVALTRAIALLTVVVIGATVYLGLR